MLPKYKKNPDFEKKIRVPFNSSKIHMPTGTYLPSVTSLMPLGLPAELVGPGQKPTRIHLVKRRFGDLVILLQSLKPACFPVQDVQAYLLVGDDAAGLLTEFLLAGRGGDRRLKLF